MYVTLGLPITKKWTGKVFFVPLDPSKPRYALEIEVPKTGTVQTAKSAVAKLMGCDAKNVSLHTAACGHYLTLSA